MDTLTEKARIALFGAYCRRLEKKIVTQLVECARISAKRGNTPKIGKTQRIKKA